MNHNEKTRYTALERRHRAEIVGGLRDRGLSYGRIARQLGISLAKVEACLGEAAALRAEGLTKQEVADEIGVPYGSLGRILSAPSTGRTTGRQEAAVAGLVEMHAMQVDVLAWFLSTTVSSAYDLANSLIKSGQVHPLKQVQRGRAWVVPKRDTAARYLGWRPADWTPPLMYAEHYRAVAQARIMLVGNDPSRWVSERRLRRRAELAATESKSRPMLFSTGRDPKRNRPHVHDGRFYGEVDGTRGWWALEVELTPKRERAHMDAALAGAVRSALESEEEHVIGLLYLCRSARVLDLVQAAYERLPRELRPGHDRLLWATGDFDDEWSSYLAARHQKRATARGRSGLHLTQEAS
ncbi:hypothetical protein [Nocardia carnea]|uniref:hypothetical protein n=1 Tax=Nocardia carnea TaxID=37328 RepID=UPI002455F31D|nr:hypothetical protein [Nocardia carnea]